MYKKKREKSLYDQVRKPMPPPGKVIVPKKGKGAYNRKKKNIEPSQNYAEGSLVSHI